ncbi:MAG: GTP-binding protein, partial [Treponema sp.]|nr:GTP-binding protein [Treponema sp.]
PEDEETIADSFDSSELEQASARLQQLNDSWRGEKLYQDGARIVLCGRTNAGKSSLFNGILKEERAIVSDIEGTTRDWIESWVDFNGIPVRLFDTAGLRETDDVIEAQGVNLTHSLSEDADLLLYLVDSRFFLSSDDLIFLKMCTRPVLLVWNKCDMAEKKPALSVQFREEVKLLKGEVYVSAKKGAGFAELYAKVKEILTEGVSTERVQAGLGSARQKAAVEEALESVNHALLTSKEDLALDAVVQDLEEALNSLGEVTGEVTADDVLGSIFSRFCVGK